MPNLLAPLADRTHLVAVIALLLGSLTAQPAWLDMAIAATVLATLLRLPTLSPLARTFCGGALLAWFGMAWAHPAQQAAMHQALAQGVAFSCLLVVLGLLRYPVRRSATVRRAAQYLLSFPVQRRYAAVNTGSHFLSLLFNVGVIPLIGDLLQHTKDRPAEGEQRQLLLAGMRGAVLMTVWSPMGLGFAIVTTSITGLNAVSFIAVAFASAMLIQTVTCALVRHAPAVAPPVATPSTEPAGSPRALGIVLLASAALLAAAIAIHTRWHWSFLVSTVLVLPLFALAWLRLERPAHPTPWREEARGLLQGIGGMRMESAIFLSANVIGAALSQLVQLQPGWQQLQGAQFPALPVLLGCLLIVPLAGALFIPHSIFVVLLAQLFGSSTLGQAHPMSLALALTLGWAMAIAISPISAMSLLTGALCGVRSQEVGLGWNRRFVGQILLLSIALIGLTYLCGG